MRKATRKAREAAAIRAAEAGTAAQRSGVPIARPKKRDESHYHKGSCDMRRIPDPDREGAADGEWNAVRPGDFWWGVEVAHVGQVEHRYRTLFAKYPDGCMACLPINMPEEVKRAGIRGASWGFDGNLDRPTLTPSVHHIGHWHGWIRAGRMQSV